MSKPIKVSKRIEPILSFTADISDPDAISLEEIIRRAIAEARAGDGNAAR